MNKDKNKKWWIIIGILTVVAVVMGVLLFFVINKNDNEKDKNTLAYTDLIKEISYGNVEKVEMTVGSTTVKIKIKNEEEEKTAIVPDTESFVSLLQDKVAERK